MQLEETKVLFQNTKPYLTYGYAFKRYSMVPLFYSKENSFMEDTEKEKKITDKI